MSDVLSSPTESTPRTYRGPQWKRDLHALLEQPASSPAAFLVHVASTSLIIFSAVLTILETLPLFHATSINIWFGLETAIVVLFTVEYLVRCLAWSDDRGQFFKWFFSFFGMIDLLGILPYYVELVIRADTTAFFRFSILRTFRLLRVFRPFRHSNTILLTIEVMYLAFMRSKDALLALGFFVVMALVVFSTLLYFAERGIWDDTLETFINSDGDPSQFASIPAAAWFVIVTMTTVGYGDLTPRSLLGRLITLPLLLFGLLLIALPSFVLGREFSIVWEGVGAGGRAALFPARGESERDRETGLHEQVEGLRRAVERQGDVLAVLVERLERRDAREDGSANAAARGTAAYRDG